MVNRNALLNILAFIILCGGACREETSPYFGRTKPKHPPNELWLNNSSEPEYIDPGKCSDSVGAEIIENTFASLLQHHPTTLEPLPDIAQSWEISADGKTYTFHLRKSVWSDGMPLTARDYEWSWKRVLDPKTDSKYASLFYDFLNAEAFNRKAVFVESAPKDFSRQDLETFLPKDLKIDRIDHSATPEGYFVFFTENSERAASEMHGKVIRGTTIRAQISNSEFVGIRAIDDDTLQANLRAPIPYFLHLVVFFTLSPVPKHVIEKLEKDGINPDLWTDPKYIVSNGAYVLKKWKFRQYALFEKNPRYWDAARTGFDRVKALMVESYNTTISLYKTADIDWIGRNTSLPLEYLSFLKEKKDFLRFPFLSVYFYWTNTREPPLTNKKVRKALSMAIDRKMLVEHVTKAGQIPSSDFVPNGLAGYEGPKSPPSDPDMARRLLAEAGYPGGTGLPKITLKYNTSAGHQQIAEAIQQMWKKELNWEINIQNEEWKVYLHDLENMNFQLARHGWFGDYPDPYTFLELLTSHNGNNHSGWKNPKYDEILRKANLQSDPKVRMAMLKEAEELLIEEQPIIPIYVYTRSDLKKPYLKGHWPNYLDKHPWKLMSIDERWY